MCVTYRFDDVNKPDLEFIHLEDAVCGFNSGTNARCPLMKGDEPYQTDFKLVMTALKGTDYTHSCHQFSMGLGHCAELDQLPQDVKDAWRRLEWYETEKVTAYADVADNPECVKETITDWYWKGQHFDPIPEPEPELASE